MYSPRPFQQGAKRRFELRVPGLPPAGRAPCFEATCRWAQLKITPEACVNASGWEFAGELPLAVRAALVQAVSAQLRAAHAERRAPGRDAG